MTPDLAPDKFLDGALLQATKGPAQYGVLGEGPDSSQIFFNTDLFDEAGVTTDPDEIAQWDWAEFTEAAKELTKRDGDEVVQSGFPGRHTDRPNAEHLGQLPQCGLLFEERCRD